MRLLASRFIASHPHSETHSVIIGIPYLYCRWNPLSPELPLNRFVTRKGYAEHIQTHILVNASNPGVPESTTTYPYRTTRLLPNCAFFPLIYSNIAFLLGYASVSCHVVLIQQLGSFFLRLQSLQASVCAHRATMNAVGYAERGSLMVALPRSGATHFRSFTSYELYSPVKCPRSEENMTVTLRATTTTTRRINMEF